MYLDTTNLSLDIQKFQLQVQEWALRVHPEDTFGDMLNLLQEELGELCKAHLKGKAGLFPDVDWESKIRDAIGDIGITLAHFCNLKTLDLESCIRNTWKEVRERDWDYYHPKLESSKSNGQVLVFRTSDMWNVERLVSGLDISFFRDSLRFQSEGSLALESTKKVWVGGPDLQKFLDRCQAYLVKEIGNIE